MALLASSCTTIREIPRREYAAEPERPHVRLYTTEGLVYEFDYVRVSGDSLTGYRRRDVPGRVEQFDTLPMALSDVEHLNVRAVDWWRTGAVGAGIAVLATLIGLAAKSAVEDGGHSGGTKPPPEQ